MTGALVLPGLFVLFCFLFFLFFCSFCSFLLLFSFCLLSCFGPFISCCALPLILRLSCGLAFLLSTSLDTMTSVCPSFHGSIRRLHFLFLFFLSSLPRILYHEIWRPRRLGTRLGPVLFPFSFFSFFFFLFLFLFVFFFHCPSFYRLFCLGREFGNGRRRKPRNNNRTMNEAFFSSACG